LRSIGSNTGRLVDTERDFEPLSGMAARAPSRCASARSRRPSARPST